MPHMELGRSVVSHDSERLSRTEDGADRSSETREALLKSAIEQFSRHGYAGASTRCIAAGAGTVMSSITYHFGGKSRLYDAVGHHIAERLSGLQNRLLEDATNTLSGPSHKSTRSLIDLIESLYLLIIETGIEAELTIVLAAMQGRTSITDQLNDNVIGPIIGAIVDLLQYEEVKIPQNEARAIATLLLCQIITLRIVGSVAGRTIDFKNFRYENNLMLRCLRAKVAQS